MKTLARLRQVRKRGGCQAAKTEVSCVNHEKGRERTIRIEKREGGESEIAFLIVTRTVGILQVIAMPEKLLRGLDQNFLPFGYF